MIPLPDVPNVPQTSAGGGYPQFDCFEECAVSIAQHFRDVPDVQQFTVRQCEDRERSLGGNPAQGTTLEIGAATLRSFGIPAHVAAQPLDDAANRDHYSVPLVIANIHGIPEPGGGHPHFCVGLGGGWYRNPANGSRTNSPALAPTYSGKCVEIDIPADQATGGYDVLHLEHRKGLVMTMGRACLGREFSQQDVMTFANAIATDGSNLFTVEVSIASSAEGQAWERFLRGGGAQPTADTHDPKVTVAEVIAALQKGNA